MFRKKQQEKYLLINPTALTQETAEILHKFLEDYLQRVDSDNAFTPIWNYPHCWSFQMATERYEGIELSHPLLPRSRIIDENNTKEICYSVLDPLSSLDKESFKQVVNCGAYGNIYKVLGTLSPSETSTFAFATHKKRLVKIWKDGYSFSDPHAEEALSITSTYHRAKKILEFNSTQLMVMRDLMPDQDHSDLSTNKFNLLTTSDQILLIINILRALQILHEEQDAVYCDIKSEHILFNCRTLEVFLIDFGFSIRREKLKAELSFEKLVQTDLSRMSRSIPKASFNRLEKDLYAMIMQELNALENGQENLTDAIDKFEHILLVVMSRAHQKEENPLAIAHKVAINAVRQLRQMRRENNFKQNVQDKLNNKHDNGLDKLQHTLATAINQLSPASSPPVIDMFMKLIGVNCLKPCNTVDELSKTVSMTFTTFIDQHRQLQIIREEMNDAMKKMNMSENPDVIKNGKIILKMINKILYKTHKSHRQLKFNDIADLNQRFTVGLDKLLAMKKDFDLTNSAVVSISPMPASKPDEIDAACFNISAVTIHTP